MSVNEFHKNDIGTVITFTIKDSNTAVDLSAVTTKTFYLEHPSGSISTISANFVTTGSDGALNFTVTTGHFDTTGTFKLQAYIADTTTAWHTDIYEFFVHPNIE